MVDDNAVVREVLGALLMELGHSVVLADGGRQALDYLETERPVDLVLTDLRMPEPSGRQVVQMSKARKPLLPVGIITGSPELLETEPEPADFVLAKPVDFDVLQQMVESVTSRRAS